MAVVIGIIIVTKRVIIHVLVICYSLLFKMAKEIVEFSHEKWLDFPVGYVKVTKWVISQY